MTQVTLTKFFGKLSGLDKVLMLLFLIGAVVACISLFRGILVSRQVQVEYLEASGNSDSLGEEALDKILVDIEGAVVSPGVYDLPINARIKDLLVRAGGYSETADRSYCEKNLNLAQVLKDGQKIYIPEVTDTPSMPGYDEAKSTPNKVNVNTATMTELDTLWGVGPARAESIVKNRPYGSMDELVSKGGMTKQVLDKNVDVILLY